MIVKDEEANLKRCLDSFLPIIHERWCELIIVDTGSTDRSIKVAKEYTKKFYQKEFIPWDFSAARNYGIQYATGERLLIVDADEELTQSSLYLLEDAVLNPQTTEPTIFIKLRNFYTVDKNQYAEVFQPRIFMNNGKPLYQFCIHNKPRVDPPYLFLDNVIFNHYGYLFQKVELFEKKKERSLPMLEAEYLNNPEDLHILTHLVKTYYAVNNFTKTVELSEKWIELIRKVDFNEGWFSYLEVFVNCISAYLEMNDLKSAERVRKESLKYSNKVISIYLLLGQYYLKIKKKEKAKELFEEAIYLYGQPGTPYDKLCTTNAGIVIPEILNFLSLLEFESGNYEKAGEHLNNGIRLNENRLPLRWDVWNDAHCQSNLKKYAIQCKRDN